MANAGRVLIVDDYEANISALRQLLEGEGYDVLTRQRPRRARPRPPRAPGSGAARRHHARGVGPRRLRVAEERARTCLTAVVLVSALQERESRLEGLEAGADDFISKPVDPQELYARVRSLIRLKRLTADLESAESLFLTLGRFIEARDPYTEDHCDRLAQYAMTLGTSMGLSRDELDALYRGAFIHDIGKIAIPDRLLLKKGKLTRAEHDADEAAHVIGDELCRTVRSLEAVRPIVRHHHERLDGRGYPTGSRATTIRCCARVVGVVDVFDALTTDRPYRKAMTSTRRCQMMRTDAGRAGATPSLVEAFVDVLPGSCTSRSREPVRSVRRSGL
jgi:putative two-component system response regulator